MITDGVQTKFTKPPEPAGCWLVGGRQLGLRFSVGQRPNAVNRFFCRLLLGWEWIDRGSK